MLFPFFPRVFIDRDATLFPEMINFMRGSARDTSKVLSLEYQFWFHNTLHDSRAVASFSSVILDWFPKGCHLLFNSLTYEI